LWGEAVVSAPKEAGVREFDEALYHRWREGDAKARQTAWLLLQEHLGIFLRRRIRSGGYQGSSLPPDTRALLAHDAIVDVLIKLDRKVISGQLAWDDGGTFLRVLRLEVVHEWARRRRAEVRSRHSNRPLDVSDAERQHLTETAVTALPEPHLEHTVLPTEDLRQALDRAKAKHPPGPLRDTLDAIERYALHSNEAGATSEEPSYDGLKLFVSDQTQSSAVDTMRRLALARTVLGEILTELEAESLYVRILPYVSRPELEGKLPPNVRILPYVGRPELEGEPLPNVRDLPLLIPGETSSSRFAVTIGISGDGNIHAISDIRLPSSTDRAEVQFTAFAPPAVTRATTFLVQVWAHVRVDEAAVKKQALEADRGTSARGVRTLDSTIETGTRLDFSLSLQGFQLEEPVQQLVWRGYPEAVQFPVRLPEGHTDPTVVGKVVAFVEGVPVGHLNFTVEVEAGPPQDRSVTTPLDYGLHAFRKAFISYASKDRPEVQKRVQMLEVARIPYFQDYRHIQAGDNWEEALAGNIDDCDLFLLFWSTAAKRSRWVQREWKQALARQQARAGVTPAIIPVIIEGPPPVKPPVALKHLHFNSPALNYQGTPGTRSE